MRFLFLVAALVLPLTGHAAPAVVATPAASAAASSKPAPVKHVKHPVKHLPSHAAKKPQDAPPRRLGETAAVRAFAAELASAQGFDEATVRHQLSGAMVTPMVQRLVMPPPAGQAKDWGAYEARFVEPDRLAAGLAFWSEHEAALKRAEEQYGVPANVIVGIIGVETYYGRIMGRVPTLDALATLSFAFPKGRSDRSALFREHLADLFVLARHEGVEPASFTGSYAGAMGWGQFMPGSWNRYGVDFDGDGHIDLIGNADDAIGSIANFLAQHGWQRGMPTDYTLKLPSDTATRAALLAGDVQPMFTAAQLTERGVELSEAGQQHQGLLAVVELQMGPGAPVYLAGTQNFYVVTRYNQSAYYAMAVIEVGRRLAAMRAIGSMSTAASSPG